MSPEPPTIDVYWRLPSHGDPASVRDATLVRGDWTPTTAASLAPGRGGGRVDDVSYVEHLGDIARAAEASGLGRSPAFRPAMASIDALVSTPVTAPFSPTMSRMSTT